MRFVAAILAGLMAAASAGGETYIWPESDTLFRARRVRAGFLERGITARQAGMGEAFTAAVEDASAVTANPSGLHGLNGVSAVAMYSSPGNDQSLSYGACALPARFGGIGVSVLALGYGSYEVRDEQGTKTGSESPTDFAMAVGIGFDHPVWAGRSGSSGVTLEVISESTGDKLVGACLGGSVAISRRLKGGWALQHVGPEKDRFALPSVARAGIAWTAHPRLLCALDAGYPIADKETWVAAGGEYAPFQGIAVRAGYKWDPQVARIDGVTGVTAGLGLFVKGFALDYSYQPFGEMATSHRITLAYTPGKVAAADREAPIQEGEGPGETFTWPKEGREGPAGKTEWPQEKR